MGKKKLGKRERAKLAAAAAAGGADTTATPVPMVVEEAEPVAPEPVAVPVVDEVKKPKRVKTAVKAESERAPPAKAAATSAPKPAPKPAAKLAAKPAPALAPTPKPAAKPTPAAVKRPAAEGAGGESKKPRKRAKKGGKRVTRLDGEAAFPLPLHHSKEMETFFCFRCDIDKTAKLQGVWSTSEGEKRLCQGCVGQTAAIARNLSHVVPTPKSAAAIAPSPATAKAVSDEADGDAATPEEFKACADCVNPLVSAGLGHVKCLRCLLDGGMKVDFGGRKKIDTPIHKAASNGFVDVLKFLLSRGADVNARTKKGMTPLHRAAAGGKTSAVEWCLENGADVTITDNDGNTPLDLCRTAGDTVRVMPASVLERNKNSEALLLAAGAKASTTKGMATSAAEEAEEQAKATKAEDDDESAEEDDDSEEEEEEEEEEGSGSESEELSSDSALEEESDDSEEEEEEEDSESGVDAGDTSDDE